MELIPGKWPRIITYGDWYWSILDEEWELSRKTGYWARKELEKVPEQE